MVKALIVYATRNGETKAMAERIAEGIRFEGYDAKLVDVTDITNEEDLSGYDAYLFGSATYHGDMIRGMKNVLSMAENLNLEGKTGGAFGAFGWSGEAPDLIYSTMKETLNMDMVSGSLRLKSVLLEGGTQMAQDYGRNVGKKLSS
jgi:flavorubredoxin